MSDSAFPMHPSLKPAPGIRRWWHGLHLPFVPRIVKFGSPVLSRADDCSAHRLGVGLDSAPGALAPVRVLLSRSIHAYQPHPSHSRAHRDFAVSATYTRCLRCAGAPRRPPSGSELSLHIPSRHAALCAPGEIETRFIQFTDFDIGLRRDLSGSALPFILPSVSGRARFRGFLVRISLRPVQLLASLDGSDQDFSQPQRLLHPGFPRVSRPSRGWISLRQFLTVLSVGLSPAGMAAILAAPDPYGQLDVLLGRSPSLHVLRQRFPAFVRTLRWYCTTVRLPANLHAGLLAHGLLQPARLLPLLGR